jgi:hypothetical protein
MSCCMYPKSTAHPSMKVGDTVGSSWASRNRTEYPDKGVSAVRYDGRSSRTVTLSGGEGGEGKSDYPKKGRKFGTEGFR